MPDRFVSPSVAVPRVRVVTLNWNAAELTARCLRSLQATDWPAERLELVVVDNASIDGSLERLRSWFPRGVRFVENSTNLGFAEGCNTALRDLDGVDYVALVNNDAEVDPGWLAPLVAALESDGGLGACCPKLVFSTPFVPVDVTARGSVEISSVLVDGLDVTGRCLWGEGVGSVPDRTVPLLLHRLIDGRGRLHVPVSADPDRRPRIRIALRSDDPAVVTSGSARALAEPDGLLAVAELGSDAVAQWHVNNLGTDRQPWHEGIDRRFGQVDDPELGPEEVRGWCGGGVLLRPAYLDSVGRFDPRFFAYYEDTDLSWRGRRSGWRYRTEPRSVLRHLHGGSAGSSSRGFFFLNYRNWLLTVLRNGNRAERRDAFAWARHLAWGPTRANVLSPLKHLRVPNLTLTMAWLRVAAGVVGLAAPTLSSRGAGQSIGARPTTRVRSRLQARPIPRPPAPRLDGPVVIYVDVSSALDSGWRAGIQRVTVELVRRLPVVADIDVVAVRWSEQLRAYRRLDRSEWAALLDPTSRPPTAPEACGVAHRVGIRLGRLARRHKPVDRLAARLVQARQPRDHRALVLSRFETGSVFLDLDASWNVVAAPRHELLADLAAASVRIAWFVHDLLPETNPEWFDPGLVEVFRRHLRAHADHAEIFLCNSAHTRSEVLAFLADRHPSRSPVTAIAPLGGDLRTPRPTPAGRELVGLDRIGDAPVVLCVGTVEPRKGHRHLLDAWNRVRDEVPDAHLVVVGRKGWHAEDIAGRIREHPDTGLRLHWLEGADDATLDALYERADVVVVPSLAEGYGLPVAEALTRGRAVVASDGGALGEIGGDAVLRVPVGDPGRMADALAAVLKDVVLRARLEEAARSWQGPGWDDTARCVAAALGARPLPDAPTQPSHSAGSSQFAQAGTRSDGDGSAGL